MSNQFADNATVGGNSLFERCLGRINERWPMLKFLSLSLYAAWILLTMTTNNTVAYASSEDPAHYGAMLYLLSGVALVAVLVLGGVFQNATRKLLDNRLFVIAMGIVAAASTYILSGGFAMLPYELTFPICSVGTGLGTGFICLSIGCVYSEMFSGNPFFVTASACLLCNLVFFFCIGLPDEVSRVVIALLPLGAGILTFLDRKTPEQLELLRENLILIESLPRFYFARLTISVGLMCIAIGVIKGLAGMTSGGSTHTSCVALSFLVLTLIILCFVVATAIRNFEISAIYYPIIVVTAVLVVACSVVGGEIDPIRGTLIDTAYNIFIVVIWCLLQDLASRTTLSSVRVYGFGRGASGAGTTLGWFIAFVIVENGAASEALPFVFVASALMVLVGAILVANVRTVSAALQLSMEMKVATAVAATAQAQSAESTPAVVEVTHENVEAAQDALVTACQSLATEMRLTAREAQALELLGRGRTVGYIADELGISYNTVKGYTKNVYAKCGVHSRQELIDAIEQRA